MINISMSVTLDFLKASNYTARANPDVYSTDDTAAIEQNYVFKDIHFDLATSSRFNTKRLDATESYKEIRTITDEEAILQSIRNILTTSPGQKLLNPDFGVNIGDLLFAPITIDQAYFMSEVLSKELQRQEPRVVFDNVHVAAQPDLGSYIVTIRATIPDLARREALNISGIITVNGVKIERIESETIA